MMAGEKEKLVWVIVASLISILIFFVIHGISVRMHQERETVKVGFVFDGDESTPYTENFIRAAETLKLQYADRVTLDFRYNVPYEEAEDTLKSLAEDGCDIIFLNSFGYGEMAKKAAAAYPDIEFCQATCNNANEEPVLDNYHTFMGEIYQGRYVAGIVAGLKLQELIDTGQIQAEQAWIGYVGAYPYAEVISGYTAFFLGARQACPTVRMRVKYTNKWTSYMLEKEMAKDLIDEGCVIISQHSDTIGPAVMCESAAADHLVYHVGYNQDMIDVAPTTSLIGTRIDWSKYMSAAVDAVFHEKKIESAISGHVHGNDVGAGFEEGWVKMLELNSAIAPKGCEDVIDQTIEELRDGTCHVFEGDYVGVNPEDETDIWNLHTQYLENETASAPSFYYILKDVIVVE